MSNQGNKELTQEDINDYFKRNRPDLIGTKRDILATQVGKLIDARGKKAETAKVAIYVDADKMGIFTQAFIRWLQSHYGENVYISYVLDTKFDLFFLNTSCVLFQGGAGYPYEHGKENSKVIAISQDELLLKDTVGYTDFQFQHPCVTNGDEPVDNETAEKLDMFLAAAI